MENALNSIILIFKYFFKKSIEYWSGILSMFGNP